MQVIVLVVGFVLLPAFCPTRLLHHNNAKIKALLPARTGKFERPNRVVW